MNGNRTQLTSVIRVFAILVLATSWSAISQEAEKQTSPPDSVEEMKPVEDAPAESDQNKPAQPGKSTEEGSESNSDSDRKPPVPAFGANTDPFLINDDLARDAWKTYCEGMPVPDMSECEGKEIQTRDVLNAESELTQRIEYVEAENGEEISHGITTLYWPEGTKKTQISYVCGVRHGPGGPERKSEL